MYVDAINYSKNCPECAIVLGREPSDSPPLQPMPVSHDFQIVGVDVMDLPKTECGNKHVLDFQDFLSKWPMVSPTSDQKTNRIMKHLTEDLISLFSVPEALLSDHGSNLLSNLMNDVCEVLGIEKQNTTAYHLQCDRLNE